MRFAIIWYMHCVRCLGDDMVVEFQLDGRGYFERHARGGFSWMVELSERGDLGDGRSCFGNVLGGGFK